MEKEKRYRAAVRKDSLLLLIFAAALVLIVAFVAYEAASAAPEYTVPVIIAAIATVGVLCILLLQIGRFLRKNAAMVYQNENNVPTGGKESAHV